jgi:IS30 family transposase
MAKRLTMAEIDTILTLHKAGHSNREISALVGVNRETVGKHLARFKAQNQPNAPTGKHVDRRDRIPAKRAHRLPAILKPAKSVGPTLANVQVRGDNR